MPWFHVDDGFSNSKPVMRIPRRWRPACIGVWTLCGSWSAKELTDGFVPDAVLEEYGATPKTISLLMDADLWERREGGIIFRNWGKWQRTKQQVLDYRAAEAERQRNWREAKRQAAEQRKAETVTDTSRRDTSVSHAVVTPSVTDVSRLPIPKPEPIPNKETTTTDVVVAKKTGARLPDGWMPDSDVVAQMRSDHPNVDLKAEHAKFVDYWQAKPGKDARKADWNATWRNWIRRAADNQPRNGHAVNGTGKPTQKAMGYGGSAERLIAGMESHD